MPDYSQGKIYKIISTDCDLVYYGSCAIPLNIRLSIHKSDYKSFLEGRFHYLTSFELIKQNNYEIVLVEDYPCDSRKELELREGEYIKNNVCVNERVAGRTHKQWEQDNRETLLQKKKQYYQDNYETIRERKIQHYQSNWERIREKQKEKIICEFCGFEGQKNKLPRHQKSKRCLDARSYNCTHNAGH
jgi:hypothetical protein